MIVIDNSQALKDNTVVAIGNFDGVHLGHRVLVDRVIDLAKKSKLKSVICTFNNHTTSITKTRQNQGLLMCNEQKINTFRDMNVDYLYLINFNKDIMHLSPKSFIKDLLIDKLNAKSVVVGFNFRFGYKATGDAEYLKKLSNELGFEAIIIPPLYKDKVVVSSTYIRQLIRMGNIKKANELLGRPYSIKGKVVSGKGIGKVMGFPTANIKMIDNYVIPKRGVYKTIAKINGHSYLSITNVGNNPTFNENKISIETHILSFNNNIYNQLLEVTFLDYIRDEKKFRTKNELVKQIMSDIEYVKLSN